MLEEKRETAGSNWTLAYDSFEHEEEALREAPVLNEDLVNLPNWLLLELRIEGEGDST
jgi:trehalose/maltose hydrolase-like predicted phosphorylase